MWNPYRNEIWTSLTLAEGVAMPYAMLALIGARKAGASNRPWAWHVASMAGLLGALGCKNVFVALIPAQMALRLWPDGVTLRDGWRRNRGRAALYLLPLLLPIAHFVYFKLNWHPGQYRTPGPSFEQAGRIASWLKGAGGADFLGVGLALVVGALLWHWRGALRAALGGFAARYRAALLCAAILIAAGVAIYLPMPMMAARYTMPAVWGVDILIALALTAFAALPLAWPTRVAWAGVAVGLAAVMVANVGRQEKFAARARMLWDTLHYVEQHAPPGARVAWVGGESGAGALNVEEGIHFQWHLFHRGRGDVRIGLVDEAGQPVERIELPPLDAPPLYRIAASDRAPDRWQLDRAFASSYRLGRKRYVCHLETVRETEPLPQYIGPRLAAFMKEQFDSSRLGAPDSRPDDELLRILTANGKGDGQRPTAEVKRPLP
jgi:hypothetical protein